ncbi:MAG: hypothetical protein ABL949_15605, partial [Fimbriimonadaceae bacterium]
WIESDFERDQEKWLNSLTEFSDCIEPEEQHSAYIDVSGHPNPQHVIATIKARNDTFRMASGDSKWIAKALCETGLQRVTDLPTSALYPASRAARERLIMLGYPTLCHVAQIPLSVLQGQFPDEALTIFRASKGGIHQAVEPIFPRDAVRARFRFEGDVDDQLVWDSALKQIARKVGERLVDQDLQGDRILMTIVVSDGECLELERTFSKSMQSPASLIPSLRLMLAELAARAKMAPNEIRVALLDISSSERKQLPLQGTSVVKPVLAMERVRTVFGDSAIQVASKVSEPRRKAVLKAWQHATGWM